MRDEAGAAVPARGAGRIVAGDRRPLVGRRRTAARPLALFAALAVSAHLLGAAGLVAAPRIAAMLAGAPRVPPPPPQATIALIEQDTPSVGGSRPEKAETAAKPDRTAPTGHEAPNPLSSAQSHEQVATGAGRDAGAVAASPAPQAAASAAAASAPAPEVNLDADGDPGTGLVSGPNVVPASPDSKDPNLPPAYPREAAMRHEEGTVGLIVSVAPDGHADAVEIASSSGYGALDDAARRAVARWHFRPALNNGQPVSSVFNQQIEFSLDAHP